MKYFFGFFILIAGVFSIPVSRNFVVDLFYPSPVFAGIKLSLTIDEIKKIPGISCGAPGRDVLKGKDREIVDCQDDSYKVTLYGIDVLSRQILAVDGVLAKMKISSKNYGFDDEAFPALQKKLDLAYKRTKWKNIDTVWSLGRGVFLVAEESVVHHPGVKKELSLKLKRDSPDPKNTKDFFDSIDMDDYWEQMKNEYVVEPVNLRFITISVYVSEYLNP